MNARAGTGGADRGKRGVVAGAGVNEAWSKMTLGDVATIQTGRSNSQDAVPGGPFPFFDRSREPKRSDRYLFDCEAVIVPGEGREFVPRYYEGPFDLHQRVYALTAFREIDGRFLYYALTAHRAYFAQVATGATVKSLRRGMFERFVFDAPDLRTQGKIAAVLSAYDDLIENSLRRIEILEKMALDLYREWFVEFRFPGHGRARFIDSALGRIPRDGLRCGLGRFAPACHQGERPCGATRSAGAAISLVQDQRVEGFSFPGVGVEDQSRRPFAFSRSCLSSGRAHGRSTGPRLRTAGCVDSQGLL